MPTLDKTIGQLKQLHVVCHAGQLLYQDCAKRAKDQALQKIFTSLALEMSWLDEHLQQHIKCYGGRANQHARLMGKFYCSWQRLELRFGKRDDGVLLDALEQLEHTLCGHFETLLHGDVSPLIREQLSAHYGVLLDYQRQRQALRKTQLRY